MKTDLIEAYLSEELDHDAADSVEIALRNDEGLREVYFKQKRMDATLRMLFAGQAEVSTKQFSEGVLATLRNEGAGSDERHFSKSVLTEILEEKEKIVPIRWPDFLKAAAVATVAALITILGLQTVALKPGKGDSEGDAYSERSRGMGQPNFMARVRPSGNAVFSTTRGDTFREDGWISGGVLDLKEGVAEIAFNSGARAILEGPAKMSVASENRAFLEFGSLTAEVTPGAEGFTVNTPRMNIVDIGTRFGVHVNEDGDTEVHVMEGVVEASRSSGNSVDVVLREGLALRADSRTLSALTPIPYAGDRFTLTAGPSLEFSPVIEYHFDESGGAGIFDTGNGRKGGPYDLSLLGERSFDDSPRRSPGLSGGGLVFRKDQSVSTSLSRDFRLEDPFTIAFWMKIPPEIGRRVDDFVVGWGRQGTGWEFGCRNSLGGGALIARHGDGYLVGSTDIADGKWHHVAVRFIGGAKVAARSHVHLYIDGALETVSAWKAGKITAGRVGELRIGDLDGSGFPGWIDHVSIFDQAVSTQSIRKLVTNP